MKNDFTDNRFDILLQAGQSNAEGLGYGPVDRPFEPSDDILYFESKKILNMNGIGYDETKNEEFFIVRAKEHDFPGYADLTGCGNFALFFAAKYIENGLLEKGKKLLIIRSAVGGTGFGDRRWGLQDDLYLNMIQMLNAALVLNPENKLKAFLWHQGENDCFSSDYETHKKNLSKLIGSVREKFCAYLPFISGNFTAKWQEENDKFCKPIIQAMRDVCRETENSAFVETDGLLSNIEMNGGENVVHFCKQALYELGERYYEAYTGIRRRSL